MHTKGRKHGRFVALSGLKKVPGPSGSQFPLIIVDTTGLPVFYLSEWYRRKKELDPGRTPDTYLDLLLPWAGFLLKKRYSWNAAPDRVRAYLVEFLRHDIDCQVGPAPEDGYLVETTGASPLAKSSLGVLLAALANLYEVLIEARFYPYENPMRSERLIALKREHLSQIKNAGAPDHAGIRSESHQDTNRTYPTAFFRQKRGKVWEPEVVMEPDAVQERMRKTIDFMIQQATFQRDKVILLLLRQTGARLSEIIEMTAGGYRNACHPERALVKNKGSRGREEKLIYFTSIIEQYLLSYIRTERAAHDPQGCNRLEQLDETDPLFLTEDGRPYTRSAFYYHWYSLFKSAQKSYNKRERVEFSPHDLRHLRVTRAIAKIKQDANGDKGREEALADGFWRLMGWHSRATMETYNHTFNKRQALLTVMLEEEQQGGQLPQQETLFLPERDQSSQQIHPLSERSLSAPKEQDEFGWYEE